MTPERRHPLRGLLATQFLGAFNDNAWRMMVVLLAMEATSSALAGGSEDAQQSYLMQTTLAFLVLTVPLMLFSLPAGFLCDRLSKRSVIIAMKAVEILLMGAAAASLLLAPDAGLLRLGILALMGVQSAVFGPAKYGILPEILPHERLSAGNGLLELWTFLAIIGGTAVAGELLQGAAWLGGPGQDLRWLAPLALAGLSVTGLVAAWGIPRVPVARAHGTLAETVRDAWSAIRSDRVLWLAVLGSSFYWGIASLAGALILVFGKDPLALENPGMLLAVFGLGVGLGATFAGRISAGKVEYGLIPLGALGLTVFILLLALLPPTVTGSTALMVLLGISSGLVVVPLNALLQWRSPSDRRGGVIALANVFAFGGMIAGNLLGPVLASLLGLPVRGALVGCAVLVAVGTGWALNLLPEAFLRLVLVLLTHTLYKLRVVGAAHVPVEGGALLVPNHVSFADGLFLLASIDRRIRFLVDSAYFKHPVYGPFLRSLRAIEISSSGGPRVILSAMREAGKSLDEGHLVCIFAEGEITRTGTLQPFRKGVERIMKGRSAPIIPVYLDRVWGSIFSFAGGRFLRKVPGVLPYPVTIAFGEPLPPTTSASTVRQHVERLGTAAWEERQKERSPLSISFVRAARRRPFRFLFADPGCRRLSRFRALVGTIVLARHLKGRWSGQEHVGILLPPSIPGALVNLAAALSGKRSVNLNYTAGRAALDSMVAQAGLRTVVTSRRFLEAADVELPAGVEPVWIEDIRAGIDRKSRLSAFLLALFTPARLLERSLADGHRARADDIVTVIFSSGSTGDPKGILLSHSNIDSNVEAIAQVLRIESSDRLLGILPLFHSFGYLALWFSATQGVASVFLPNPLDAVAVGETVQRYRVTVLIGTPTFLALYQRRATPGQFGSLRLVLAGAEKLSERFAQAFEDRFGIRPLEGYGTTECAPVVAASTLDYRAPGFFQPGSRRGSVGPPLPGVSVKIVDPDDLDRELPPGAPGMLLVKGPNVMHGYLNRDDLTRKVMRDGWYITGDIAMADENGFLWITDRVSRFSKIGGEMVPHGRVEEALQEAAGADHQVFAVTSIPDERKGERLAVLHTIDEARLPEILERLAERGLPNLFIPRPEQFVRVDELPLLGTGKLDLREVKRRAMEALGVAV